MDDTPASVAFRDVVIVGGGCYGTFYAGQLIRAGERERASYRRILVVDRDPRCQFGRELGGRDREQLVVEDWGEFFDRYLAEVSPGGSGEPGDAIVPSPLMPHLMYEWLVRQARIRWPRRRIETKPVPQGPGTPYDVSAPDGTRYVSFADWTCPTHCIEPAICPIIKAPRSWEMADALSYPHPPTGPLPPYRRPGAFCLPAPRVWRGHVRRGGGSGGGRYGGGCRLVRVAGRCPGRHDLQLPWRSKPAASGIEAGSRELG